MRAAPGSDQTGPCCLVAASAWAKPLPNLGHYARDVALLAIGRERKQHILTILPPVPPTGPTATSGSSCSVNGPKLSFIVHVLHLVTSNQLLIGTSNNLPAAPSIGSFEVAPHRMPIGCLHSKPVWQHRCNSD